MNFKTSSGSREVPFQQNRSSVKIERVNLIILSTLSLLLCVPVFAQPEPEAQGMGKNPPEAQLAFLPQLPDTPEKAARYFLNAMLSPNGPEEVNLTRAVAGARMGFYGSTEWEGIRRDIHPLNSLDQLKFDAVTVVNQTETEATVAISTHREIRAVGRPVERIDPQTYTLPMHLETNVLVPGLGQQQKVWRVVPLSNEEVRAKPVWQLPPLQLIATFALYDQSLLPYLQEQRALSQIKQLSLGILQFLQDYDLTFAFESASYDRVIRFYVIKRESLFIVPTSKGEKWQFNDNLSNKKMNEVPEPTRTVLLYDGEAPQSDKVNFRFGEETPIAFVDGHCELLSKDELKNVIWKP